MTISTSARLAKIHSEALLDFDAIQSAVREERMQCLEDRRFYSIAGAQWEGPIGDQFENKPRFEMNKVHLAVIRIINEYRNNRITVDFSPKDGTTGDKMADTCDGLYRADEQDSTAEEAYDNAFEEAVGGGMGAWRLRACYEDEDDDEDDRQRIRLEPIYDADSSVFFDLDAKRQDKADAKRCYVLTGMSPTAYREEYSDDPTTWPKDVNQCYFDWCTPDVVYVAEVYRVEETSEVVHVFRGLDDEDMMVPESELQADDTKLDTLLATGFREVRRKRMKRREIHKYIMSGGKVLKDKEIIPGRCIPIVPVYGKRWYVDNVERCMGHVRIAKDAQRLANMLRSFLGDLAGRSNIAKPIFTPGQIAGHANMWSEDNVKEYPYLLVNPLMDSQGNQQAAGAIGYTKAPEIPQAWAALMQVVEQDMGDLLGNQQAGEQLQPNMSGKAVELIQNRLDMQAFLYMSNFAKGMRRSGQVWLSMSKDILVENSRRMKTVDATGTVGSTVINEPSYDTNTEQEFTDNDMSGADLDVNVDVGPSSSSRRAATVRALTGMMQITQDPETLSVLSSMALMNMEGEGLSDTRDFFRARLVKMGVIKPTEEEAQQLAAAQQAAQNAPPDPQAQFLLASAQEAEASAASKRADTVETIASADLKKAQTAQTYAETMGEHNDQQIASAQALKEMLTPPEGQSAPSINIPPPQFPDSM